MQSAAAVGEKWSWRQLGSACLLHWHLCSLDAPTVAVVWAIALARLAAVRVGPAELSVLALGTWIVYVLDRVLDGQGVRSNQSDQPAQPAEREVRRLQERHYFHRRHQAVFLPLCALAAIALGLLCRGLPGGLVAFYVLLGLPVAVYGAWVHGRLIPGWLPTSIRRQKNLRAGRPALLEKRLPPLSGGLKEAAVAVLFTAAVAAPALTGAQPADRRALLPAALLLAMLCWLNCSLISHAEAPGLPARHAERRQLTAAIAAAACASAVLWAGGELGSQAIRLPGDVGPRSFPLAAAGLLSCLLLLSLLLGLRDDAAGARRLRVLADVGLLTPLIFLLPHA